MRLVYIAILNIPHKNLHITHYIRDLTASHILLSPFDPAFKQRKQRSILSSCILPAQETFTLSNFEYFSSRTRRSCTAQYKELNGRCGRVAKVCQLRQSQHHRKCPETLRKMQNNTLLLSRLSKVSLEDTQESLRK